MLPVIISVVGLVSVVLASGVPLVVSPGLNLSVGPGVNCTDLHTGFNTQCFVSQNVSNTFLNFNVSILPEICGPSQSWSECFQIQAYATPAIPDITRVVAQNHVCTTLTTNTNNSHLCSPPNANAKAWTLGEWYGVWSIYNLQSHISIWAQAISTNTSHQAISNVTTAYPDGNASTILSAIFTKYGLDLQADDALKGLLAMAPPNTTTNATAPQYPPYTRGRVPNPADKPTVQAWIVVLQARLQEILQVSMSDFDAWFGAVKKGYYASPNLAIAGQLINSLKQG